MRIIYMHELCLNEFFNQNNSFFKKAWHYPLKSVTPFLCSESLCRQPSSSSELSINTQMGAAPEFKGPVVTKQH